jgi:hypothetical protein
MTAMLVLQGQQQVVLSSNGSSQLTTQEHNDCDQQMRRLLVHNCAESFTLYSFSQSDGSGLGCCTSNTALSANPLPPAASGCMLLLLLRGC